MYQRFLLFVLISITSQISAQEKKIYFDARESTEGVDIKTDSENDLLILGAVSAYTFPPPIYYRVGSRFLKLNSSLNVVYRDSFRYDVEDAGTFMRVDSFDNIFVPFVRRGFDNFCDSDSMSSTNSYRMGFSALIKNRINEYQSYMKSFNENGYADWPTILGMTLHKDSILMVFSKRIGCQNPSIDPYFYFHWMDLQGNTISMDSTKFFPYQPSQNNFIEITENHFLKYKEGEFLVSCLNGQGESHAIIIDYKGNIIDSVSFAGFPRATLLNSKKGLIKYWSRQVMSFDQDFNLIAINKYSADVIKSISDIEMMPNDSLLITFRDDQNRYYAGLLDPTGKLIARKEYTVDTDEGFERLEGITAIGTEEFAVVGTKERTWDFISDSVPPKQLFVFTDKISELEPYTSPVSTIERIEGSVEIFPNPTNFDWIFKTTNSGQGKIYNLSGQLIDEFEHRGGEVTTISGQGFVPGLYIINWRETQSGENQVLKIIKK